MQVSPSGMAAASQAVPGEFDSRHLLHNQKKHPRRVLFVCGAVCSSRLSFLAQSADCFALGHRADETCVRAHLAPKKRYQRFS